MPDSHIAIRIEGLGKKYRLGLTHAGSIRELVNGMTDRVKRALVSPFRRSSNGKSPLTPDTCNPSPSSPSEFWALRDVSLDVHQGEVVGVIGKNGAGKSTLLKILSRVTKPTAGRATIAGRVGSLLEVGTGFHPELTGRENIFLNGTILGMSKAEIAKNYDDIVDFSEIGRFIDTPVKRYSSGMYVRLAFAVAAHLEPEVLIVDEVLAVGDVAFQKKCLGKMESVGRGGRTILFVSHNMGAIRQLCQRAILLEHGRVVADGAATDVVDQYLQQAADVAEDGTLPDDVERVGTGEARIQRVQLLTPDGEPTTELFLGQPCRVRFGFEVFEQVTDAQFEISIHGGDGTQVYVTHRDLDEQPVSLASGAYTVEGELDISLLPRRYWVGVGLYRDNGYFIDRVDRTISFDVMRMPKDDGRHYRWGEVRGYVRPQARWNLTSDGIRDTSGGIRVATDG